MRKNRALLALSAVLLAILLGAHPAFAQDQHLAQAVELRGRAVSAYDAGDYDLAAELARQAKAELALVKGAPAAVAAPAVAAPASPQPEAPALPASYTVRLLPEDRDCLSKIAGYPFVYGDREKWPLLYRANKGTLKHPGNADLILPHEVLVIPSIAGEAREGEYDPGKEYPAFAE